MSIRAYLMAFEQATNDLSWIDRELERLHTQQKQLTELLNCLKHFLPDERALLQEHAAACEGAERIDAMADSQVTQAMEPEASPETGEPAAEQMEAV